MHNPQKVQHGHDLRTGELLKKQHEEEEVDTLAVSRVWMFTDVFMPYAEEEPIPICEG